MNPDTAIADMVSYTATVVSDFIAGTNFEVGTRVSDYFLQNYGTLFDQLLNESSNEIQVRFTPEHEPEPESNRSIDLHSTTFMENIPIESTSEDTEETLCTRQTTVEVSSISTESHQVDHQQAVIRPTSNLLANHRFQSHVTDHSNGKTVNTFCDSCFSRFKVYYGEEHALALRRFVNSRCLDCPQEPILCRPCFTFLHC